MMRIGRFNFGCRNLALDTDGVVKWCKAKKLREEPRDLYIKK